MERWGSLKAWYLFPFRQYDHPIGPLSGIEQLEGPRQLRSPMATKYTVIISITHLGQSLTCPALSLQTIPLGNVGFVHPYRLIPPAEALAPGNDSIQGANFHVGPNITIAVYCRELPKATNRFRATYSRDEAMPATAEEFNVG